MRKIPKDSDQIYCYSVYIFLLFTFFHPRVLECFKEFVVNSYPRHGHRRGRKYRWIKPIPNKKIRIAHHAGPSFIVKMAVIIHSVICYGTYRDGTEPTPGSTGTLVEALAVLLFEARAGFAIQPPRVFHRSVFVILFAVT